MDEGREGPIAEVGPTGGDVDCDWVVEEDDLLVGVAGRDGEGHPGVEAGGGGITGGGGEVEGSDLQIGDREVGPLWAVEDPDHSSGDGGEEDEGEDGYSEPDAEEATPVAAAPTTTLGRGGAVGWSGGVVELGLWGRKGRAIEGLTRIG